MLTESRQGLILKFHSLRYLTGRLFEHFTIVTFKSLNHAHKMVRRV